MKFETMQPKIFVDNKKERMQSLIDLKKHYWNKTAVFSTERKLSSAYLCAISQNKYES